MWCVYLCVCVCVGVIVWATMDNHRDRLKSVVEKKTYDVYRIISRDKMSVFATVGKRV